jgi:hypothetical protein
MDVLSNAEGLQFFVLDIVKVCVVLRTVGTNAFHEDFVNKVYLVDSIIGGAIVLHVQTIQTLAHFAAKSLFSNAANEVSVFVCDTLKELV